LQEKVDNGLLFFCTAFIVTESVNQIDQKRLIYQTRENR